MTRLLETSTNKYHAVKTYSELCGRMFDSKAEARRGEELALLEKAGIISALMYQVVFPLYKTPKITITIDFSYVSIGERYPSPFRHYEDVKGVLTRDFRTKLAWLKEKYSIEVKLIK